VSESGRSVFDQALSELREAGLIPDSFRPDYVPEFLVGIPTGDPAMPNVVNQETFSTLDDAVTWRRIVPDSRMYSGMNKSGPGGARIYRGATLPGKFGGAGPFDALTKTKLVILHEYGHEIGGFSSEAEIDAWALKQLGLP
jgi:hypothetical protein